MVHVQHPLTKIKATAYTHKSVLVANELMKAIRSGAYRVGDKLPAERTLAKLTGVSRAAVREALSALHVIGVVESYVGDGTYLRSHLGQADADHALGLLEEEGNLEAWLEAREVVESAVARLAVDRADDRDVARLDDILAQMVAAIDRFDVDDYLQADLLFHTALVAASHNETLDRTASALLASMQRQLWKTLKRTYYTQQHLLAESHKCHGRIVAALRRRDDKEMTRAMRAHFRFLNDGLEDSCEG